VTTESNSRCVALGEHDLLDAGERQIFWRGQHLDGAGGDPPIAAVGGRVRDWHFMPGQRVYRIEQGFAVLFHRQHELPADVVVVDLETAVAAGLAGSGNQQVTCSPNTPQNASVYAVTIAERSARRDARTMQVGGISVTGR
jgi:hypothetical protein